eukprot:2294093-Rhodomonas_salina.2
MADILVRPHLGTDLWVPRRSLGLVIVAILLAACVHVGHQFNAHAQTFQRQEPALKQGQITLSRAHAAIGNVRIPRKVGQVSHTGTKASERRLAAAPQSGQHPHQTNQPRRPPRDAHGPPSTRPGGPPSQRLGKSGRYGGPKDPRKKDGRPPRHSRNGGHRGTSRQPFAELPQLAGAQATSSLINMTTAPALKPSIDLSAPSPEWTTAPLLASLLQQATTNATVEEIPPEAMAFGEGLQGGIAGAQAVVTIVSKGFSSKPGVGNSVHCGREVRVELRKGAQNVGEVHAVAGSCIAIANGTAVNVPQIGNESGGGARACLLADEEERCEEYVVSYSTASVGERAAAMLHVYALAATRRVRGVRY